VSARNGSVKSLGRAFYEPLTEASDAIGQVVAEEITPMDYRALLLVALTATSPVVAAAQDAGTPPPPEHDYTRCGQMRAIPDWCREHQEQERERQRVRVQDEHSGGARR
jgi:hypothetical protein